MHIPSPCGGPEHPPPDVAATYGHRYVHVLYISTYRPVGCMYRVRLGQEWKSNHLIRASMYAQAASRIPPFEKTMEKRKKKSNIHTSLLLPPYILTYPTGQASRASEDQLVSRILAYLHDGRQNQSHHMYVGGVRQEDMVYTYMHTYMHTYIHAYIHAYMHTYIRRTEWRKSN